MRRLQQPDPLGEALSKRGYKLTQPRLAVLRVIAETDETLTPAEVHQRAQAYYPQTGLVTVYRTLDLLVEAGAVRKVHQSDGCHSFAPASQGHAHHLICQGCKSVVEFAECDLDELLRAVQRRTGYQVSGHWLELFGLCPQCREQHSPG
jgi:Fur family ferric uptake transcriptional regulator